MKYGESFILCLVSSYFVLEYRKFFYFTTWSAATPKCGENFLKKKQKNTLTFYEFFSFLGLGLESALTLLMECTTCFTLQYRIINKGVHRCLTKILNAKDQWNSHWKQLTPCWFNSTDFLVALHKNGFRRKRIC